MIDEERGVGVIQGHVLKHVIEVRCKSLDVGTVRIEEQSLITPADGFHVSQLQKQSITARTYKMLFSRMINGAGLRVLLLPGLNGEGQHVSNVDVIRVALRRFG